MITSTYEKVKLGDVVTLMHQGINTAADKVEYADSGVPIIQSKHFTSGTLSLDDSKYLSEKDVIKYGEKYTPKLGDILFSNIGTVGKSVVLERTPDFMFAWNVFLIRLNSEKAHNRYIKHFFDYLLSLNVYERWFTGGTVKFLNKKTMAEIEIPLPSLDEQKRIAAILDKADAIRRKRQQAIELADDFLRSVFLDMFGDPVTNSKGWEVFPIKKIATVTTGGTPSRKVPEYYGNDIEWIKSDNINTPQHTLTKASEYLSIEGRKVARTVPKGSTLITCIAGSFDCIGNAAFADREVSFNQQINALTPKEGVLSWYLYALIIFSKRTIQNASTNSMKGMISKGKLECVELIHPPIEEQRKFELIFDKQMNSVDQLNKSYKKASEMFNSLSQKAFAGEL